MMAPQFWYIQERAVFAEYFPNTEPRPEEDQLDATNF